MGLFSALKSLFTSRYKLSTKIVRDPLVGGGVVKLNVSFDVSMTGDTTENGCLLMHLDSLTVTGGNGPGSKFVTDSTTSSLTSSVLLLLGVAEKVLNNSEPIAKKADVTMAPIKSTTRLMN